MTGLRASWTLTHPARRRERWAARRAGSRWCWRTRDGEPAAGYLVTDGGVLFATADHGVTWRCYGLVDPEEFLLDLGFVEASDLPEADAGLRGRSRAA